MEIPFLVSYILLWVLTLGLGFAVFLLFHEVGQRYLSTPAGISRDGLAIGQKATEFSAIGRSGNSLEIPGTDERPTLLVFGSTQCLPCQRLMSSLSLIAQERPDVRVVFASTSEPQQNVIFAEEFPSEGVEIVTVEQDLVDKYLVRVSPFAFIIPKTGQVSAKGLVNEYEGLRHLVAEHEREEELERNENQLISVRT